MVTTPPYLASARWYADWLRAVIDGAADADGCVLANSLLEVKGKGFSRTSISAGDEVLTLSVAVAGGAGRLRRMADPGSVELSLHGNWPHAHLGALEAVYGRAPYYSHLRPELQEIYSSLPADLGELNRRLHSVVITWLTPSCPEITQEAEARGRELLDKVKPDVSVVDLLMRYGPEAKLALLVLGG